MLDGLGLSRQRIYSLSTDLIGHLRTELSDTQPRADWTKSNLDALRSFKPSGFDVICSPSGGTADASELPRGEFLTLDFIADVEGRGILIAAESEWYNTPMRRITEDFEKLLYIRSPIKIVICRIGGKSTAAAIRKAIFTCIEKTCSELSPGEMLIIYCRKWSQGASRDEAFLLQVNGEPVSASIRGMKFQRI